MIYIEIFFTNCDSRHSRPDRESKPVDPRVKPEDDREIRLGDDKRAVIPDLIGNPNLWISGLLKCIPLGTSPRMTEK